MKQQAKTELRHVITSNLKGCKLQVCSVAASCWHLRIGYPTNIAADLKTGVKKVQHRHVGEAKPMEARIALKVKLVVETVDLASLKWISSHHWATVFSTIHIHIYIIIYTYIWYAYFRIAVVGEMVKSLALDEDSHHGIFLWTRKCQAWLDSCSSSDCQSLSRHRLMGVVLIICLFEMATATSLARESYVSLVHIFRLPIHSIALKAHIMGLIQGSDCIFPQRIDVGKHFIMTGGPEVALLASRNLETLAATNDAGKTWGWNLGHWEEEKVEKRCLKHPYALFRACHAEAIREPYEDMISRVSSFGRYLSLGLDGIELIAYSNSIGKNEKDGNHDVRAFDEEAFAENPRFDLKQLPVVEKLFENPKFLKFAKSVCPKEKQILDWRDTGFGTICVVGLMVGQDLDVDVRQGTVHHNCGTLRCTRILSSSTSSFPCPDKL